MKKSFFKRLVAATVVTTATLSASVFAFMGTYEFKIGSNIMTLYSSSTRTYKMSAAPYIQYGTNVAMIPVGDAAKSINNTTGCKCYWDPKTKLITVDRSTNITKFKVGSSYYIDCRGVTRRMSNGAYAEIKNNKCYVPAREFGDAIGMSVNWNSKKKTIYYDYE